MAANVCSKIVPFIVVVVVLVVIYSWVVCSCWLISSSLVFILHIPQVKRSVSQIGPLKVWIVFCTLSFTVLSRSQSKTCSFLKTVITSVLPLVLMASACTLPHRFFGWFYSERKPSVAKFCIEYWMVPPERKKASNLLAWYIEWCFFFPKGMDTPHLQRWRRSPIASMIWE